MKKLFIIASLVSLLCFESKANQTSISVINGTMTNLFSGYGRITQIVLANPTTTNAFGYIVDTPTNALSYVTIAYSNVVSYITNVVTYPQYFYTNYYGVVTTLTNLTTTSPSFNAGTAYALVDVTNSVPQATNSQVTYGLGVAASGTSVIATSLNIMKGAWFTNSGAQPFNVTVVWTPQ